MNNNNKKRILIPISFSFSIRYLYRTGMLHKIREFAIPVIVITWNEQDLVAEMKNDGFEVVVIPESRKDEPYANVRTKIDYWFNNFVLTSTSKKVQKKYLDQFVPKKVRTQKKLREKYNQLKFYIPGFKDKMFQLERSMLKQHTNYNEMMDLVKSLHIDIVFTPTPFQTQEDILLRVCKDLGKQMIAAILSFDNLTKRGWIPVGYDYYMVWNKYNYKEALSIYPKYANEANTKIVGAAQFDFYFDKKNLLPIQDWKQIAGLPVEDRKIILYAGGPKRLFPNEPQYLKDILNAVDTGEIKGSPIILFRCHPVDDIQRWKDWVGEHPNLFYDVSWTGKEKLQSTNVTFNNIYNLCSTLAYTHVHINLCSTMTVDGCAYHKPQIGPAYDDVNPSKAHLLRGMYSQEHFKPIIRSKGLKLANSKKEMVGYINEALQFPEKFTKQCNTILDEIITYRDGKSTDRVVEVLRKVVQEDRV